MIRKCLGEVAWVACIRPPQLFETPCFAIFQQMQDRLHIDLV